MQDYVVLHPQGQPGSIQSWAMQPISPGTAFFQLWYCQTSRAVGNLCLPDVQPYLYKQWYEMLRMAVQQHFEKYSFLLWFTKQIGQIDFLE